MACNRPDYLDRTLKSVMKYVMYIPKGFEVISVSPWYLEYVDATRVYDRFSLLAIFFKILVPLIWLWSQFINSKYVNTIKHQPRYFLERFGALSYCGLEYACALIKTGCWAIPMILFWLVNVSSSPTCEDWRYCSLTTWVLVLSSVVYFLLLHRWGRLIFLFLIHFTNWWSFLYIDTIKTSQRSFLFLSLR